MGITVYSTATFVSGCIHVYAIAIVLISLVNDQTLSTSFSAGALVVAGSSVAAGGCVADDGSVAAGPAVGAAGAHAAKATLNRAVKVNKRKRVFMVFSSQKD
jgi:hypothetical protein